VDHRPDPVLRRERDLDDRGHDHPLRRPQHDLRPPLAHHRPRTARRTIDNNLRPSSFERSCTTAPSAITKVCATRTGADGRATSNVAGRGTSSRDAVHLDSLSHRDSIQELCPRCCETGPSDRSPTTASASGL
jgi:hypothetical protein